MSPETTPQLDLQNHPLARLLADERATVASVTPQASLPPPSWLSAVLLWVLVVAQVVTLFIGLTTTYQLNRPVADTTGTADSLLLPNEALQPTLPPIQLNRNVRVLRPVTNFLHEKLPLPTKQTGVQVRGLEITQGIQVFV